VAGALAVIRYAKIHGTQHRAWLTALLARRPTKVAAIALANKIARMVWAMMAKGERYKEPVAAIALGLAMLKRERASHFDPPASSYAIMRRARPYRGENPAPGEDVDGGLDPTAGIRERPRPTRDMHGPELLLRKN
jgi:hypothetical protein